MSVTYNVIQRGEPGVAGGGTKKFYASAISTGEANINALTNRIEKISTVSGAASVLSCTACWTLCRMSWRKGISSALEIWGISDSVLAVKVTIPRKRSVLTE